MPGMSEVNDILKKALALPAEVRAALAGSLLESLDSDLSEDANEEAWAAEIKRRVEEITTGKVEMIPYEEIRRRLAARLDDAGS